MMETGWLIEVSSAMPTPIWWMGYRWTRNANEAVRFARKQDAQQVIDAFQMTGAVPLEHSWDAEEAGGNSENP